MSKRILIVHGSCDFVDSKEFFGQRARADRLEQIVRKFLHRFPLDVELNAEAYAALGEPLPPVRKLKGKIPRYQQALIDEGKLPG